MKMYNTNLSRYALCVVSSSTINLNAQLLPGSLPLEFHISIFHKLCRSSISVLCLLYYVSNSSPALKTQDHRLQPSIQCPLPVHSTYLLHFRDPQNHRFQRQSKIRSVSCGKHTLYDTKLLIDNSLKFRQASVRPNHIMLLNS